MIRSGNITSLQNIDEEGFILCLKYYLEKHFTNKFLQTICIYLTELSSNDTSNSNLMRKAFSNLIPTLVILFSNNKLCPSTLCIICKCLCILTSTGNDKANKKILIEDGIFKYINKYIDSSFEKLVFYILTLTYNILIEAKEIIGEVLVKNSKIYERLIQIIKGTNIPEVFYSTKVLKRDYIGNNESP